MQFKGADVPNCKFLRTGAILGGFPSRHFQMTRNGLSVN